MVARNGETIDIADIKARVTERLPNYMRPAAYQLMAALPTLPASGKVDRKALAKPEITIDTGRTIEPPATPMEEKLYAIWTEAFAPQPVSVTDDLFEDLGGHSLKAARLVSAARKVAGWRGCRWKTSMPRRLFGRWPFGSAARRRSRCRPRRVSTACLNGSDGCASRRRR